MQIEISIKLIKGNGDTAPEKTLAQFNATVQQPDAFNKIVTKVIEVIDEHVDQKMNNE